MNVLAADQADIAMHFAGRTCIPQPSWVDGPTAPIIAGASATFSCVPWAEYDGGDHVIFIGEIVDAVAAGKPPLLFYRSTFHSIGAPSAQLTWAGCARRPGDRLVRYHPVLHPHCTPTKPSRGVQIMTSTIPAPGATQKNATEKNATEKNYASRPMTGDEYIESLRDDREIWLHGERVKDVTTHPAFRNPIRMTARLYDAHAHRPARRRADHARPTPATAASPCRSSGRRTLLGGPAQGARRDRPRGRG